MAILNASTSSADIMNDINPKSSVTPSFASTKVQ